MESSYLYDVFVNCINGDTIQTIVECGSRDCLDAIELVNYYRPKILYSFECNPECIPLCEKNIEGFDTIKLVKKAVCTYNGKTNFHATDMERSLDKNIGASSLLLHRDNKMEYFQKSILVDGIRLDAFMKLNNIERIDLLCMDVQGAEPLVITGLGRRLRDVHYIISEISTVSYYHNDMKYHDFNRFMEVRAFKRMVRAGDNVLYKNMNYHG